jgi:hypothetical protein
MRFVPGLGIKLLERRESELDALIVEVPCRPAPWVCALVLLAVISVIGRSLALDSALPMLCCRGACGAVVAPAGSGQAAAQEPSLDFNSLTAIAQAQVNATVPFGDASLPDDNQPCEALATSVMVAATSNSFAL